MSAPPASRTSVTSPPRVSVVVAVSTIAAVRSAFLSLIESQSLGTNRSSVESVSAPPARCTRRVSRPSVSRSIVSGRTMISRSGRPCPSQEARARWPAAASRLARTSASAAARSCCCGQRVLRLLLRRGVLASLPLAVDGGLLRLVRGLLVLSGLLGRGLGRLGGAAGGRRRLGGYGGPGRQHDGDRRRERDTQRHHTATPTSRCPCSHRRTPSPSVRTWTGPVSEV